MTNKYLKRIKAIIIEKTGTDPEELHDDSYFEDDLNVSEMELVELIAAIEEEYDIEFDEEEKENIFAVMDLVELVTEKLE
ncbi:acyl carrier protein [Patescibacteria group bacterium]|nr:acyl carrier protein [Patescibacteria group bacterium]